MYPLCQDIQLENKNNKFSKTKHWNIHTIFGHFSQDLTLTSCPHFTTRKKFSTLKLLYTLSKTSLRVCHNLQITIILESAQILFSTCVHYSYANGKSKHTGLVIPSRNYFCPITSILSKVPWSYTQTEDWGVKSHVTVVVTGKERLAGVSYSYFKNLLKNTPHFFIHAYIQ